MHNDNPEGTYLSDLPLWSEPAAAALLEQVCKKHGIPVEVISQLVSLQRERQHQERAHGITKRIEEILGSFE